VRIVWVYGDFSATLYRGQGGPQDMSGRVWKTSPPPPPIGARFPERPARSESLYQLSSPGPFDNSGIKMNIGYWWNIIEREKSASIRS
jgi:hypothetical protein